MASIEDDGRPGGLAESLAALDGLQDGLEGTGRALEAFDRGVGRAGRALTRAFVEGEGAALDFGATARGVLADLSAEMLRLAVVNPLKNLVLDDGLPLLGDLLGQAIGGQAVGGQAVGGVAGSAAAGPGTAGGAGLARAAGTAVAVTINTPDARSFLAPAAESQMSAQLARAVRRGQRSL